MKIVLDKKKILQHLELAISITSSNVKITSPVIKNILVSFEDESVVLKSINNNICRCISIIREVKFKNDFKFLINPKVLFEIISKSNDEKINIEKIEENVLRISYFGYETNINLIEYNQFPDFQIEQNFNQEKVDIKKSDIDFIYKKIIFPFSSEINIHHQIYDSVQIDSASFDNKILFSYTNSIQLSNFTRRYIGSKFKFCIQKDVFKSLDFLFKINNNVSFFYIDKKLYVVNELCTIEIKNWEEIIGLNKFGDVTKILRKNSLSKIFVFKKDLINALEKSMIFKKENTKTVKIIINKSKLTIKSKSEEIGNSKEILNIKSYNIEDGFEINIDANYFLSSIKFFNSEEIEIGFGGSLLDVKTDPIVIKEESTKNYVQILALSVS